MKLTVSKSYVDPDGRVMAVTMPMPEEPMKGICSEEPTHNCFNSQPNCVCAKEWKPYREAIKQVKDTSVVYEDQTMIIFHMGKCNPNEIQPPDDSKSYPRFKLKPDTFYAHDTVEVEIGDQNQQCPEFPHFGARYPDATCIDGFLWDLDSNNDEGFFTHGGDDPCPFCNTDSFIEMNEDAEGGITREVLLKHVDKLKEKYSYKATNVARILPIVEKPEPSQNDLWIEAIKLFNTKEHTQDGRDLLMDGFVLITRRDYLKILEALKLLPSPPKP